MNPVSPALAPKLSTSSSQTGPAKPFVMAADNGDDAAKGATVGPDCTMPADNAGTVPAAELVASLDRSARTSVSATADADAKDGKDTTSTETAQPPVVAPQLSIPANPFAALLAAAPVVVQAIAADQPVVDDGVQAAKLPEMKAAGRSAMTDMPVSKPVDPAAMALLTLPKDLARVADRARSEATIDVSVSLLSDTSDTGTTPTFALPTTATLNQASSALQGLAAMPADAMINRHLDLARGDAWLDTLAQDIAASAGTGDKLRFALQPEHLGKLDVEVSRHDNGVAVHMTTRSEEARAIIAAAQPRLVDDLRANGTRVVAADVTAQMNAQTNGQSGGASRPHYASFIEAAVDAHVPTANVTTNAPASGRYA